MERMLSHQKLGTNKCQKIGAKKWQHFYLSTFFFFSFCLLPLAVFSSKSPIWDDRETFSLLCFSFLSFHIFTFVNRSSMMDWIPIFRCIHFHAFNNRIIVPLSFWFSMRYFFTFYHTVCWTTFPADEVCWTTFLICESFLHFHDRSSVGRRPLVDGDHKSYFKISLCRFFLQFLVFDVGKSPISKFHISIFSSSVFRFHFNQTGALAFLKQVVWHFLFSG